MTGEEKKEAKLTAEEQEALINKLVQEILDQNKDILETPEKLKRKLIREKPYSFSSPEDEYKKYIKDLEEIVKKEIDSSKSALGQNREEDSSMDSNYEKYLEARFAGIDQRITHFDENIKETRADIREKLGELKADYEKYLQRHPQQAPQSPPQTPKVPEASHE
jgi:hypothetical protein